MSGIIAAGPLGRTPVALAAAQLATPLRGNGFAEQVLDLRRQRDYLEFRMKLQGDLHEGQAELIRVHQTEADRLRERTHGLEMILDAAPPELGRDPKRVARWIAEQRGILATSPEQGTVAAAASTGHTTSAAAASLSEHNPACTCADCSEDREREARRLKEERKSAILNAVFTPLEKAANPNAGVKPAFPKGRWP